MQQTSRQELYRGFIEFIRTENQRERNVVNRRMMNVFFWCFLLPAIASVSVLLLIKFKVLPRTARGYLDWLVLVFPVFYSLYFLSSEVLRDVPRNFRRGGMAVTLGQSVEEGKWRERVCDGMRRSFVATVDEMRWVAQSFEMDLKAMLYRTRYLTGLAGAVFFLLMQGIDSLTDGDKVSWSRHPVFGWIETSSNDFSQFVGLALFLLLLYLSGSQTYHALQRYQNCLKLLILEKSERETSDG